MWEQIPCHYEYRMDGRICKQNWLSDRPTSEIPTDNKLSSRIGVANIIRDDRQN